MPNQTRWPHLPVDLNTAADTFDAKLALYREFRDRHALYHFDVLGIVPHLRHQEMGFSVVMKICAFNSADQLHPFRLEGGLSVESKPAAVRIARALLSDWLESGKSPASNLVMSAMARLDRYLSDSGYTCRVVTSGRVVVEKLSLVGGAIRV